MLGVRHRLKAPIVAEIAERRFVGGGHDASGGSSRGSDNEVVRVLANSAEVGVPPSLLLPLGALKAAGAIGLIVGLGWSPTIGTAAAAGLTLFFVGAVAAHVRTSVFHNIAFPATYLALSATTLILGVAQS